MEEQIIDFVRQNPVLWDRRYKGHKNLRIKDRRWQKLAETVGMSTDFLKRRWKTIRDRYLRISKLGKKHFGQKAVTKYKYGIKLKFLEENNGYAEPKNIGINLSTESSAINSCNELMMENVENCIKYEIMDEVDDLQTECNENHTKTEDFAYSVGDDEIVEINKNQFDGCCENNYQNESNENKTCKNLPSDIPELNGELETALVTNSHNSSARLFVMSLALQIEKANLSAESFLNLQIKILNLLKEEINYVRN